MHFMAQYRGMDGTTDIFANNNAIDKFRGWLSITETHRDRLHGTALQ